ncbi:Crp/Fnr family transcriptional regulator [Gynuella sp.]|uniref:Crp/Fnr family transcriptional regulator n=1 Tax=Gynuella sp. TaxID=2969146 RepID=UPI003D0A87E1
MEKHGALLALRRAIGSQCQLSEATFERFSAETSIMQLAKSEVLLAAQQPQGKFWFVVEGLLRNFYITDNGKEFNKSFISAPGFCGSMAEILQDQPNRFAIAALENSTVLAIPIQTLQTLRATEPAIMFFELAMAQQLALKKELREAELLLDDASTRYRHFCEEYPYLLERIPAYHIASYLGISEVALSRIKRNLNRV